MLACAPGIETTGERLMAATSLASCIERHLPNVLLLDTSLLDELDPRALRRIQHQAKHVRVILLSDDISEGLVADVLRHHFNGLLLTTSHPGISLKAIDAVVKGELWLPRAAMAAVIADLRRRAGHVGVFSDAAHFGGRGSLTRRESQVAALVRGGCMNKEIAQHLGITEGTVKKHLQNVFGKLGVHRRTLVALCRPDDSGAPHSIDGLPLRKQGAVALRNRSTPSQLRLQALRLG